MDVDATLSVNKKPTQTRTQWMAIRGVYGSSSSSSSRRRSPRDGNGNNAARTRQIGGDASRMKLGGEAPVEA